MAYLMIVQLARKELARLMQGHLAQEPKLNHAKA